MKRSTKIIAATVLSVGVVGSGIAAYKADGWRRGDHIVSHIQSELDLTPEQTAALSQVRDRIRSLHQSMREQRRDFVPELLSLIDGPTLDQTQALALIDQKTSLLRQHAPEVLVSLAGFYDGLSAEQQARVREHIGERMRHRHEHH